MSAEHAVLPPPGFDWREPDYPAIFRDRLRRLEWLRANPDVLPDLRYFYRSNIAQFITDWGVTLDPRNVERGLPALIPLILYPKQIDLVQWMLDRWRAQENGVVEKSRDTGFSWVSQALACSLCIFFEGMSVGFGSRKEEYVDKADTPKCLFYKGRAFVANLPREFRGSWTLGDAPHMRIGFPDTGSFIGGEAGDGIGRGDRTGMYIVDESAHLERPELIEASLSMTTNCRIDASSVKGMNNPFARKRWSGKVPVFILDWRDDPRKGAAWYAQQQDKNDPVVLAQEVDRDYQASVAGVVIPSAWVRSAIGACDRLGVKATGSRSAALDVADEGVDKNALCAATGVEINFVEEWSGAGGDIFKTTQRAFALCDALGLRTMRYDADGLGAGVRGDARIINEGRPAAKTIGVEEFRGSGAVLNPEKQDVLGWNNEDYFENRKAQAWWSLRMRFEKTHRWVTEGVECDPSEIISLSPTMPLLAQLASELSQPTCDYSKSGKILIVKAPKNTRSPNLADAAMMRMAGAPRIKMQVSNAALRSAA